MSAVVSNLRRSKVLRNVAGLLPAVVLPLALMGVTVQPAYDLRAADLELLELRGRARHCAERRQALRDSGGLKQLEGLEALRVELRRLMPDELTPVQIYSYLRQAAGNVGLELSTIRGIGTEDLGLVHEGETIVLERVQLSGRGELGQVLALLAQVRAAGLPTAVLDARLTREQRGGSSFAVALTLGLFHHAPAAPTGPADQPSPETHP